MATSPLPAGDAPANGALAPDTFYKLACDGYVIQGGVEALFQAVVDALDQPPPVEPSLNHSWNQALLLATVGLSEARRLGAVLEAVEVAGSSHERFAVESRTAPAGSVAGNP